ncbi:tetratricopeptide repeat protein [Sulfurimonas sp. SAG-AH-194-C21]|nr:tetratricopeptide repeat protein [Sulfurimonas sp. SAG-AH-194-C21]MDF1882801.1 tetratricopeptide repeat protein [Sulfurimonas sp. SAG-AH-194-C21]
MKYSKIVLLLSTVLPILLSAAEPSAFGAGDLTSSNPYGLTSNEKVILDTKNKLHKVSVKSNNQADKLDSLRERIDGLQSIIESLSRQAHKNKIDLKKQIHENELKASNSSEYEKRLSELAQKNETLITQQKVLINEITLIVDEINKKYVSKNEFNALVKDVNDFKTLVAKELKNKSSKISKAKVEKKSSGQLDTDAKAFFDKQYYTNAIKNYELLISRNYKPAYAHYMIGEMNYKRKNYSNAISYFKKSSALYSKASYMPALMLHTALSMEETGDTGHAKAFFGAIVAKYPNSAEASEAKLYLQP